MAVYSARQSSFSDGDTITAAHTNDEFNAILAAFHVSTGHTHDGSTAGNGGPLSTLYSNAISFGTGADTDIVVTFNANTNDGVITWMEDEDFFKFSDAITVGVDDTGHDVKFFGATAGSYFLWDESADSLLLTDSTPLKIGDAQDLTLYHDGSNSYITNAVGALKIATETSGIAVTIGHTTSEVTIADNLTVTGTLTLGSNAELTEAELEMLDGITAGTVAASKAVVVDANKDAASFRNVTLTGELDAATLDISGNADIAGTTNLDAVDIDGAVQIDSTITVGADDQGYDIIFYGDTASANMTWDTSADDLILNGAARIVVPASGLVIDSTAVSATAAEINLIDGGTSRGTTSVASGDGILINDGGTMRMTNVDTVSTYFASHSVGGGNVVTTGALNSGSITSGFGSIDNGSSAITTTGTITYGSLSDGSITITAFVDEDNMSSNSATLVPTQQSVKAYVDTQITAEDLDVSSDSGTIDIDLNSETLTIAGGTGLSSSASSTTVTLAVDAAQTGITSLLATDIKIGEDDQTKIDFEDANTINFYANNAKDMVLSENALTPGTSDGTALGTGSLMWSDLFLASGSVINFNNGDVTLTHSANTLTAAGGTVATAALTSSTITASGIIKTDDTTEATSTTDGSLQTDGGLSVAKDAVFGDDVKLLSDAAVLNFGADNDVSLTHVADTALLLNSSRQLQFGDSGTYIHQSADGVLDLVSDTEIEINATTIDINGNVEISGDLTVSGDDITMGTNTSGAALIADGTNFNPVVISGDIAIATNGAASIQANSVDGTHIALGSDASGDIMYYNGTNYVRLAKGDDDQVLTLSSGAPSWAAASGGGSSAADDISAGDAAVTITTSSGNITIDAAANDSDIILKGTDGGADTTFLTIDGSDAGTLIANHNLELGTDSSEILFGADNEVKLIHNADKGLILKHTATADDKPVILTLQTGETDIAANDVIGKIEFQAPDEGTGTDAILVAAGIQAVSEGDFSSSNNATKLSFLTGASEAAAEKMSLSSAGLLTIADDLVIKDGGTIGVSSDADAMTIASNGAVTFSQAVTASAGIVIDNLTIVNGGNEIDVSSSDLYFDVEGDIVLDANGADINLYDNGAAFGRFTNSGTDLVIQVDTQDKDILFKGDDGGSAITGVQFDMSDAGAIISKGNVTAFGSPSDIRLKENIEVIPNALDKVSQLQGITFNYKKDGKKSTGLIAQELEKVLPEVVYDTHEIDNDDEKFKAVRYGNVVGLLVEAIKELKAEVKELKEAK